jgi:nucleotide-binding universal stress UspA family protein
LRLDFTPAPAGFFPPRCEKLHALSRSATIMFKRILCPIDCSPTSLHAVEHAGAVARWYEASITALHVHDRFVVSVPGWPVPAQDVTEATLARVQAETAGCLTAVADLDVRVLVDVGDPATRILERANTLPADLIVIGTHGAGGFEHLVLGSVTEKVLRKAGCAVLTVPPHATRTSSLPFKRVLCAVDFSVCSLRAFDLARSLAQESHAGLTAVSVIEWPWPEPPAPDFAELPEEQAIALSGYRRQRETSALQQLTKLADDPALAEVTFEPRIRHGKAHVEILRTAADIGADLIVIGVHGRNVLDLNVFGSTTHQVVRQATCPVLTLRSAT